MGEGETKIIIGNSVFLLFNILMSNVEESVLLKEKWASHIHPEEKGTSHVWIRLKKELTSSDLHI